jgi:hypothetical protein
MSLLDRAKREKKKNNACAHPLRTTVPLNELPLVPFRTSFSHVSTLCKCIEVSDVRFA